ncbi:hypothetical protein Srubr_07130 [Streptomyces rubradiris]|uniref:Uncharacterized protein n=1 Tax=Streptomyces rubradiris TaxID=285531 RepID=A0ABQ3R514_STRRR|nr:hypothetical protein GCM10018792_26190 [Streptomyces rubradiris]GHI50867.1 hypothetical protein Srubr_07130 [Streptomyces rubradiris]
MLNAATFADMALRGRPSSQAPAQTVDKITQGTVPGSGEDRENRLSGLGGLSGIAVGVGTGVVVSLARHAGLRLPCWLGGVVTGALAMTATDLPTARLGVSDPAGWSASDWVSDAVPHLMYGLATYGALHEGSG